MATQGDVPLSTGTDVEVSATLVRAVADVVLPLLPALRDATPVDDALRLGRRGLRDPFTPALTGLPDAVPDVLYPVLAAQAPVPPAELLAHPVLAGLDLSGVERAVTEQRRYRRMRESGEPAHWELVPASDRRPARVPDEPNPVDGLRGLVGALSEALGRDPVVTAVVDEVDGADGTATEPELAARRGATVLGVGVAVAAVVQRAVPGLADDPDLARTLGWVGYARAVALLDHLPAPAGYDAAVRAEHRRSSTLPRAAAADLTAPYGELVLVEGFAAAYRAGREALAALVPRRDADFSANGLVTATDGVLRIRTREPSGRCEVTVAVRDTAPDEVDTAGWDEVVETTWTAAEGLGVLVGDPASPWGFVALQTPPWPGTYRVRVHAVRPATRHGVPGPERYLLVVWPAPAAPDVAHRLTDDLGRRLRGEPAPRRPEGPVSARWISYDDPCSITVVTGSPRVEDVVAALGGDPDVSVGGARVHDVDLYSALVVVRPVGDVVLVVEPNGACALHTGEALSAGGRRAATYFWNVNARTQLALAEDGVSLAGFEPGLEAPPDDPLVADLWADLDLDDLGRTGDAVLGVVERFTGFRWQRDDARVLDTERAFVVPPS